MNKGKKIDIILMNPPYGDPSNGGMYLDMQFVEKCNKICNKLIVIHPASRFISNTKIGKQNIESKHLKKLYIEEVKNIFDISTSWKYIGIYEYDNENEYETIEVEYNNEIQKIGLDYEERSSLFGSLGYSKEIINIFNSKKKLLKQLKEKYNTMCNDEHGFIYEENRLQRGKRWGVTKKDNHSLDRVKKYLKEGEYKYCLYKGSFNHEYDDVQEWKCQNPDELFKGQICWLTNKENVKNNIKYWLECPLCDLWRKYIFGNGGGTNGCHYGEIPAIDFEMNEDKFKEYVDSLNKFTKDEIKELKKFNIHNADKL